jgi:pimeloyl-ACP methyl ester carboxylesterase
MKQWFVSELTESLGTSVHDVQLILNQLAGRPDIDMNRVGMFGMGSGASIAILAAHADPRIKTLDLLDPWGDWPDWLEFSPAVPDSERATYLMPEFLKSVAPLDPVSYLPSLRARSLRLQQTLSEPVTPKIAKERIAGAVPDPSQLVKYTNAEDLLKAWKISGLSGWIKQQMRSETPKSSGDERRAALSSNSQSN